jgi:hypothetical protein
MGQNMHIKDESSVCTCSECAALIADNAKSVPEDHSKPYVSGSGLKKVYHTPVLTIYGTLSDPVSFDADSRNI